MNLGAFIRRAEEPFQAKHLLEKAEEQFDAPTQFVHPGDDMGGDVRVGKVRVQNDDIIMLRAVGAVLAVFPLGNRQSTHRMIHKRCFCLIFPKIQLN